jgi:uncharacterized protein (TIGR04255 family)
MPARIRPSFKIPPIVEVVCGIQFRPLTKFQAPHYGIFWETIKKDFPRCRTVPALTSGPTIELQPNEPTEFTAQVQVNVPDMPRVWFISNDETCLIQLQPDRLLFNWREGPSQKAYPRFKNIVAQFRPIFAKFKKFVSSNKLGQLSLIQTEVTYINHIKFSGGFDTFAAIGELFPDLSWRRGERFVAPPDNFQFRSTHPLPNDNKLFTSIASAKSRADQVPLIRFDLSARGSALDLKKSDEIWRWYDQANTWIVDSFLDLTSKAMQRDVWKRTR